ncbi:DUF6965 family protein [Epilithonimonas tenax]
MDKISLISPIRNIQSKVKAKPKKYAEIWSNEIAELEQFYANTSFPTEPIKLNECSTILDVSKFIQSNLMIAKANNGNRTFLPYLNRVQQLRQILTPKY